MKKLLIPVVALGALFLAGCADGTGLGSASEEDRQDILAELDASGFLGESFGDDGVAVNTSVAMSSYMAGAVADAAPRWGRRHRQPTERSIRVDVDVEAGIAHVTKQISFEGEFLFMDEGADSANSKLMVHTMTQSAVLRRLTREEVDAATGRKRRWQLDSLTIQQWTMGTPSEPLPQPVNITLVEVYIGDELVASVDDPTELFDVTGRIPRLRPDAQVRVEATVENEPDAETFVFLHVFHANPERRAWRRVAMEFDPETGTYGTSWVVRHDGRERIVVDAIDGDSFNPDDTAEYSANLWAIPYVIEDDLVN